MKKNALVSRAAQKIIYINENDQKPHSKIFEIQSPPPLLHKESGKLQLGTDRTISTQRGVQQCSSVSTQEGAGQKYSSSLEFFQ